MEGFSVSPVGLQHQNTHIARRNHSRIEVSMQEINQNI